MLRKLKRTALSVDRRAGGLEMLKKVKHITVKVDRRAGGLENLLHRERLDV